jgi:hypothetical protein
VAVGSLRWLSKEARQARIGTTAGASGNGHGRGQLGRELHTVRERVKSLGMDVRARTEFGHGREVRARTVGADGGRGLPGACSKHSIGRTTATFCDHLQQICTIQCI